MRLVKKLMEEMPLMGNSPTSPQSTTLKHTHNEEVLHKSLSTTHMHTHMQTTSTHTCIEEKQACKHSSMQASHTHNH